VAPWTDECAHLTESSRGGKENVWEEESGEEMPQGDSASGVGEVVKDLWGSIWGDDK
jgi:hypothetical protein